MAQSRRLENRVAVVTGGGNGIGAAYCRGMAAEGARVVVADLDGEAAEAVAKDIRADGAEALAVTADVSSEEATQRMAQQAVDRFGSIDVLVNNAAIFATVPMSRVPIEEVPIEEWDLLMAVNLRGTFLACRAVLGRMRQQESGSIINISSGTALSGSPSRIHYVTSKAGILGFTRCLAREVGPAGIRVNTIAPGSTLSESDPDGTIRAYRSKRVGARALPRIQYPDDLVGAAVFLASDESSFITGQTLVVDGGAVML
ncbi:3-oxoacyl-ACP reductase family protein [Streptomyces sp. NPDC046900]|uniref:SDR family NAD(P)-dependent oxidoreductase n=1 Tax=Streptomyces sp. NPDC046900 TaxID=3155473 RepID=UPI0033E9B312